MKSLHNAVVLIIDDAADILLVAEEALSKTCRVITANNPADGFRMAVEQVPDLILLDVMLSEEEDGFHLCERLHHEPATSRIPILFLTSLNAPEQRLKGFKVGGVDYITKPFDFQELRARVITHLRLSLYEQAQMEQIDYLSRNLRTAEENHAFFANNTSDVFLQCAPDGRVLHVNRTWQEWSGSPHPPQHLQELLPAEEFATLQGLVADAKENSRTQFRAVFHLQLTHGGSRPVQASIRLCHAPNGELLALNIILTDISELVSVSQGFESAIVTGRSRASHHLKYLETVSHEIRTSLNLLRGGINLLPNKISAVESTEEIKILRSGIENLSTLLIGMLEEDEKNTRAASGLLRLDVERYVSPPSDAAALVVDDNRANRIILRQYLRQLGFQEIDEAGSGEECLALWARRRHHLVFLDYQMDGIDGFETCSRIRQMPNSFYPTIIGVSSVALLTDPEKARSAGFCAQLPKPVSRTIIRQTLTDLGWPMSANEPTATAVG